MKYIIIVDEQIDNLAAINLGLKVLINTKRNVNFTIIARHEVTNTIKPTKLVTIINYTEVNNLADEIKRLSQIHNDDVKIIFFGQKSRIESQLDGLDRVNELVYLQQFINAKYKRVLIGDVNINNSVTLETLKTIDDYFKQTTKKPWTFTLLEANSDLLKLNTSTNFTNTVTIEHLYDVDADVILGDPLVVNTVIKSIKTALNLEKSLYQKEIVGSVGGQIGRAVSRARFDKYEKAPTKHVGAFGAIVLGYRLPVLLVDDFSNYENISIGLSLI